MLNKIILIKYIVINFLLLFSQIIFAENNVSATRVWPASDYTRVTIESALPIENDQMILQNPERVVIDLKDILINNALKELGSKVIGVDPNIKKIRVAQFNPEVTRVVIDLKSSASVKIFSLKPIKKYKHRLVIDIYPKDKDEIAGLLKQLERKDNEKVLDPLILDTKKTFIVAIDAGHGGEDPGAVGAKGTQEKVVNLQISKRLKKLIDKEPFMKAVLIRTGDYFIPLGKRVSKARKIKADVFISIHADASSSSNTKGLSVYTLSDKGLDKEAEKLAAIENSYAMVGTSYSGNYLRNARNPSDFVKYQRKLIDNRFKSTKFASTLTSRVKSKTPLLNNPLRSAGFAVLKSDEFPSVLVELGFVTNEYDRKNLRSGNWLQSISSQFVNAINEYFK